MPAAQKSDPTTARSQVAEHAGSRRPIRVTIVNDYEILVKGLERMLEPFADQLELVPFPRAGTLAEPVDLVLYDMFSQRQDHGAGVADLLAECNGRRLVIYTWNMEPALVQASVRSGASAHLDKRLNTTELVDALERVHAGEVVVGRPASSTISDQGDWPGRGTALTSRESEIIALITQGLSNQEIADRSFLSVNTVKSYIRSSYRKMSVTSRSRAVIWGIEHGFRPDHVRLPDLHARG